MRNKPTTDKHARRDAFQGYPAAEGDPRKLDFPEAPETPEAPEAPEALELCPGYWAQRLLEAAARDAERRARYRRRLFDDLLAQGRLDAARLRKDLDQMNPDGRDMAWRVGGNLPRN